MSTDIQVLQAKIEQLKQTIDQKRPLNKGELAELKKWYQVTYTYHSNAIEGNSLTLEETRLVVEDGITVDGKPLREIFEATNHSKAVELIYELARQNQSIDETTIKSIHKLILTQIDDENAGQYRKSAVYISGETEPLPPASEVFQKMETLFAWLHEQELSLEVVAKWHYDFVKIHPFVDGNGRTARLVSNLMLIELGYPIQIIPIIRRREYISSLHSSKTFDDFYAFFLSVQYENMKDYLRMLGD